MFPFNVAIIAVGKHKLLVSLENSVNPVSTSRRALFDALPNGGFPF
jgi:hypothetical protein